MRYSKSSTPILRPLQLLLLGLFPSAVSAVDISLLSGSQGGGHIEHISTGSTLNFADDSVNALIFSIPRHDNRDMELLYSRQKTRLEEASAVPAGELIALDVHYLHLGGTVFSEEFNGVSGFLSGGLGVTRFNPSPGGAVSENRASLSLGMGARWMPTSRVGLRLEGRLFGTLFNSNTAVFCSGGCTFAVSGELLTQYALFGGLVIHFD